MKNCRVEATVIWNHDEIEVMMRFVALPNSILKREIYNSNIVYDLKVNDFNLYQNSR